MAQCVFIKEITNKNITRKSQKHLLGRTLLNSKTMLAITDKYLPNPECLRPEYQTEVWMKAKYHECLGKCDSLKYRGAGGAKIKIPALPSTLMAFR